MANRFRSPRGNRRTPNRGWSGLASTGFTTIAPSAKVLIGTFVLNNPGIDETILRSVGMLAVSSDQQAASEDIIGGFGMIFVTDLAAAAGIASIPDPITDIEDHGWFLYVPIVQSMAFQSSVGVNYDFGVQYPFDSKAKRKIEEGTSIAVVASNSSASFGFQVAVVLRILTQVTGT